MQLQNKRLLIIGGGFGVLVVVGLVLALWPASSNQNSDSGQHVDAFSHEIVSNPPGRKAETFGTTSNKPVFYGMSKLTDYGLSLDQISNVETAFSYYSKTLAKPISQVSIDVDHITTQHDSADPNSLFEILFKVQFDEKSVCQARVEYSGLNDVRLYLSDLATKKTLYDSGTIYSSLTSD